MLLPSAIRFASSRTPAAPNPVDASGPYLLTSIDIYSLKRGILPVDKGSCSYQVLWNTFKRITTNFSATEKQALYQDTAAGFYRV